MIGRAQTVKKHRPVSRARRAISLAVALIFVLMTLRLQSDWPVRPVFAAISSEPSLTAESPETSQSGQSSEILSGQSSENLNDQETENQESVADIGYQDYWVQHAGSGWSDQQIILAGPEGQISSQSASAAGQVQELSGLPALMTGEDSIVQWQFDVPVAGLYRIEVDYYPTPGTGGTIERAIYLDGELPFHESYNINFSRVFADAGPIGKSANGDDLRPEQVEKPDWRTAMVGDQFGYFGDVLYYDLSQGAHALAFRALREPMAIGEIRLISTEYVLPTYEQYLANHQARGAKVVSDTLDGGFILIQAESADLKSDPTLYPVNDNTSPATMPSSATSKRLNAVGGTRWNQRGQWLTWQVDVPASGFYWLGTRSKQNIYRDMIASRTLSIDGQVPFQEAAALPFLFSDRFQVAAFGEDEQAFLIYLEQGRHEITLSVTLGSVRNILMQSVRILADLNRINLQLIALMGTMPDDDRDYQIDRYMPELLVEIDQQSRLLQQVRDELVGLSGQRDERVAQIDQMIFVMNEMVREPARIAALFGRFRDMVSSFGNWMMETREQPLLLDYLFLAEPGAELPRAEKRFFDNLMFNIQSFFASFLIDYSLLSEEVDEDKAITVWIGNGLTGGRDQALALNKMISERFVSEHGIPVKLQLVPPGTILAATLAGKGPDVALQLGGGEPVNFAMRHAVLDLTQFDDFAETSQRFQPETFTQFLYRDGVYALPETFSFPMMFYRRDILRDMGLSIESIQTWDDVINLLTTLQQQNMSFGLYPDMSTYSIFLYQLGGSYYRAEGAVSNLDDRISIDAFAYWMAFYTNYGLFRDFSFINRFRTGEMPIGIADYTTYNMLSISAPEIKGQWGMTEIPGTRQPDGSIDRTAPTGGAGTVIMQASKHPDQAWEFLKWWTSADAQYVFGRELESVMGPAARYNTANIEAMGRLPWPSADRNMLMRQMTNIRGTPEVPGGYYTWRYLDFAKVAVYDRRENPKDVLMDYVDEINAEIRQKRKEFGMDLVEP